VVSQLNFELLRARKEAKKTQQNIFEETGIDRERYGRIERGITEPTFEEAVLIGRAVTKNPTEIFLSSDAKKLLNNNEQAFALEPTGTDGK
jgi:transcriptional regulator with XRE-family HTH domain